MKTERAVFFYCSALIFLVPIIRVDLLIEPFLLPRFIFLNVVSLSAVIFFYSKWKTYNLLLLDLIIIAFAMMNYLSISWAHNFGESLYVSQAYFLFMLTYLTLRYIIEQRHYDINDILELVPLIALTCSAYVFYQYALNYDRVAISDEGIYLINGLSGHKNTSSSHLFLLLGLLLLKFCNRPKSLLFWISSLCIILAIGIMQSRAVYLAIFSSITVIVLDKIFVHYKRIYEWVKSNIRLGISGFMVLVLVLALFIASSDGSNSDLEKLFDSTSISERGFVWLKTLELIQDHPILGVGAGNWKLLFPQNDIDGAFRIQEKGVTFIRAHNDFLEAFAETGVLGGILYSSIFLFALIVCINSIRKGLRKESRRAVVLLITLIGYIVIANFSFPKERIEHQILLSIILAIVANLKVPGPIIKVEGRRRVALFRMAFVALLLLSVPLSYYRFQGEQASKKMILATSLNLNNELIDLSRSVRSNWSNVNKVVIPYVWYEGIGHYRNEDFQQAVIAFEEAYQINPYNFKVLNNYGSALVQIGDYQKAIKIYNRALSINPKFEQAMFNLSYAYHMVGNKKLAISTLEGIKKDLQKKEKFIEKIEVSDFHH